MTVDPPEEVVGELLLGRHAERRRPAPRRVDPGEHVAEHAVLAAGVHRLEHDEERLRSLGEQHLLQLGQPGDLDVERGLGQLLLPSERLAGVVVGEVELTLDAHEIEQLADVLDRPGPTRHRRHRNLRPGARCDENRHGRLIVATADRWLAVAHAVTTVDARQTAGT